MTDSARHRSSTIKPARITIPPSSPTSPTPTQHTGRIRAHLAHLLPRHAAFTLTLTLHQLHNVPLVHGEFGLKWKIKGVTSHSGNGILDKVKARKAKPKHDEPPSIAKGSDTDNASLGDAASASDAHSIANSSSHDHAPSGTQPVSIPAVVVVSTNHPSSLSVARSFSGASSIASVGSASSSASNGRFIHRPPDYLSPDWSRQNSTPTHDTETGDASTKLHYSPAKGSTPFVKLREHRIVWEKTLKFVVQMGVSRDNGELGDCLAKFVVMQRVIAGDPDAPRNPRLGAVSLNLAQYVDAGVITRRYLLRQSKTNATLKLTIHLEHTAGELAYVAPPLPKGEILSGVAGFLESSDIYRTRPRASDLYTGASSDSSSDDAASGSDASSIISGSGASHGGPSKSTGHGQAHGDGYQHATIKKQRRPFEVAKLPTISDPKGTEKLIEALFNPVPVRQPSKVTPFTYLVEVDGEGDGDVDVDGDGDREQGLYRADRTAAGSEDQGTQRGAAEADDDGSLYADSQDEGEGEADGVKSDYHSLRSYPSVQGSLRSRHSTRSLASKVGLKRDKCGEDMAVSTGVQLGGATERRWWQKVLNSPNASRMFIGYRVDLKP
ncbi:hypothetical protein OG21DRAFT_1602145 [Imleria badia]|nr:hypothetical protein OG21DRAFT_1602145 [Imleria badia]